MKNSFIVACNITDDYRIKIAALLHDIGKGETKTESGETCIDMNGNETISTLKSEIHFYNHEDTGSEISKNILKRLKFSKDDIDYISYLIKTHMFTYKNDIKKKGYIRFFNGLDSNKIPIFHYIMLIYCDHQGNEQKPRIKFGDFINGNYLLQHYWECKYDNNTPFNVKDLNISGKEIMELGVKPGPQIGDLLNSLYKEVVEGKIKNLKHELLFLLKENIRK